jgi:hypothetical protein
MSGLIDRLLALIIGMSPGSPTTAPDQTPKSAPKPAPKSPTNKPATAKKVEVQAKVPTGDADKCVEECPRKKAMMVASGYEKTPGQVGNGYCVPYVQSITEVGVTKTWKPGQKLSDRPELAKGTAIATFNDEGVYASNSSGNHAAIFDGYDTKDGREGFYVYDQYRVWGPKPAAYSALSDEQKSKVKAEFTQYDESKDRYFKVKDPGRRFIKFENAEGGVSNDGDAYSTIEH